MHLLIAVFLLFTIYVAKGELTEAPGATVAAAQADGPAAASGIAADDVILTVGGVPVEGADGLGAAVRSHEPGDVVPIVIARDGAQQTVEVTLGTNSDPQSPNYNAAFLGVNSRGATTWDSMSVQEAATSSVTDVFPLAWQSAEGLFKVLNPVNIVNHLSGENDDITTRPTTLVGRDAGQRVDR